MFRDDPDAAKRARRERNLKVLKPEDPSEALDAHYLGATQRTGADRAARLMPQFGEYQEKTTRTIPALGLVRR
jgi:hypothetical protein